MRCRLSALLSVVCLALVLPTSPTAQAQGRDQYLVYVPLPLPATQLNMRLQAPPLPPFGVYPQDLTGGIQMPDVFLDPFFIGQRSFVFIGGIPFKISKDGTPAQGFNGWNSFVAQGPNPRVLNVPAGVHGVTAVRTLINTYWGQYGTPALACIEFFGDQGAYYRKDLIGGVDIRDYNDALWTNTINNTTTVLAAIWAAFPSDQRLDIQYIQLPSEFLHQTLTQVSVSDLSGATFVQRVLVAGITAQVGYSATNHP